jgi:hypothetical protein
MTQSPMTSRPDDATQVSIDEARSPFVKNGVDYWRSLCGQRRFPARGDLSLRGMATILPFIVIVGVIDGGADYEYRYVGDAERQAFKTYFKGIRVTQIEAHAPEFGRILRSVYEQARSTRMPFIVRGLSDHEPQNSQLPYHESAFLPLGVSDDCVDHLLIVGVQIPKPFWDLPTDKLQTLTALAAAHS